MPTSLIIFTSKKLDDVIALGGTGWWKINPVKALRATYVVLTHNAFDKRRPGEPERHGDAFLVATIKDVIQDKDGRWLIQFGEFAETNAGLKWPGYRNPVNYVDTDETLRQLEIGNWTNMRDVPFDEAQSLRRHDNASLERMQARQLGETVSAASQSPTFGEIIESYRDKLAADLGVERSAVRISIDSAE